MRLSVLIFWLCCACSTVTFVSPRPSWSGELAGGTDCQRWARRVAEEPPESRWLHRALWRWCRCLLEADNNPAVSLRAMVKHKMPDGYLSDAIAESLADEGLDVEVRQALARELKDQVRGKPAAALAYGNALIQPLAQRSAALRDVLVIDPEGWRGRRARALLAERSPPEEASALFEAALKPHPSVLASLGHSEFGGSIKVAQRWLDLCQKHPRLECTERARKRLAELSK